MALKTVRVPDAIAAPFAAAEEVVSRYFRERTDDPEHGRIEIGGERYVLVRAASLSVEFFALVQELYGPGREREADEFARNILFDLAHAIGRSDAHRFHARMGLEDPIARLSAGPVLFAHAGWAFVDIHPSSRPTADGEYLMLFEHPYSFEADAWLRAGKKREFAACIMNAGYSSGWCAASFGMPLVSAEVLCRAKGDPCCRFLMAPPDRIEERVREYCEREAGAGRVEARVAGQRHPVPDFFARKRIEEELRRTRDELEERVAERTREVTRANERVLAEMDERQLIERELAQTQKLEAVGRLAGGIAHDFNNLMAVVIGNAGLLARRLPEGDPARVFVEEISGAGRRASELTRQLLAFSRAQVPSREAVALTPAVAEVTRMLRRVVGEQIVVVTRLDEQAGTIEADRGQIEQVVMNLVVNARDAMPGGGTVTIETERVVVEPAHAQRLGIAAGPYARLRVSDTGGGMDAHVRAHLFDPFFTTKTPGSGTGLGLSTVYGIVRQASGAIDVHSAPGEGARFDVYLPCFDPVAQRPIEPPVPRALRGTETLLVVEDQERLRVMVGHALRDFGYQVLEAGDAATALTIAGEHPGPIHLLLADIVMPQVRGPHLAALVRELRPQVALLYMSGYVDYEGTAEAAEELRGDALLAKPFTLDALARKVRDLLDR